MKKLLWLLSLILFTSVMAGCTVSIPVSDYIIDDGESVEIQFPVDLYLIETEVTCDEYVSYYDHQITGKIINTGGAGQFKLDVYYCVAGFDRYWRPAGSQEVKIDAGAIYPVTITAQMWTKDVYRFKVELYELLNNEWALKETEILETPY